MSRRFSPWQKLMALAPTLLLLVSVPAQGMMRCRIDGLVREACCCPNPGETETSRPVVKAQDCCDRELADQQRPKAEVASAPTRDGAPVASVFVAAAGIPANQPALHRLDRPAQRHGSVREGPRLVLLKQAFLI
jgi:hypothetical protein